MDVKYDDFFDDPMSNVQSNTTQNASKQEVATQEVAPQELTEQASASQMPMEEGQEACSAPIEETAQPQSQTDEWAEKQPSKREIPPVTLPLPAEMMVFPFRSARVCTLSPLSTT